MKVVVISPEGADPREPVVLAEMIDAGLQHYHVRKPSWSALEVEQWILFLPEWCRARLVLHQHHELVAKLGLGGLHFPATTASNTVAAGVPSAAGSAEADDRGSSVPSSLFRSRSCHSVGEATAAIGHYDSVFLGPVFKSISKANHGPAPFADEALSNLFRTRPRSTRIVALGGISGENAARCVDRGFDGVAVLGAVWQAPDPMRAYLKIAASIQEPSRPASRLPYPAPVMCLTQDGLPLSHAEQARQLCAAGAKWVQLRMKNAPASEWLAAAREVVGICRAAGATCVVNDSVEVTLASGADGVHLGKEDDDWAAARKKLGPKRIVGGTVNNIEDARRARAARCLDYVGIGPFRFTTTKARLAPVLGAEGIRQLLGELGDLPAWVIGGVTPADGPAIRRLGAAGVAVSASLYASGNIAASYTSFVSSLSPSLPKP